MSERQGRLGFVSWSVWLAFLTGCPEPPDEPEQTSEPTITSSRAADATGSCIACHPRQFDEWLGSSHNYGNGLDGTYQSLELTANYYVTHVAGAPVFRQNLLCITCHAPSAAAWVDNPVEGQEGHLDANVSLREQFSRQEGVSREIARPAAGEDLLPPAFRAVEFQTGTAEESTPERINERRQLTYQGITCDACHKVGRPLDDRFERQPTLTVSSDIAPAPVLGAGEAAREDFDGCTEPRQPGTVGAGETGNDPLCRRRSRGQHPHDDPFFDVGISNFAVVFERGGDVRFGPFPGLGEGDDPAIPAIAHNVSAGATWVAPDGTVIDYSRYNVSKYSDGTPFPDQPLDERPFLKTSQFCGACHDVRLDTGLLPNRLEPVHNEPFLRLENLYTEWFISPLNLFPAERGDSDDPREQWPDNPYRDENGAARRLVCQDCHMSLFPYAPPGTFPGEYTHPDDCDVNGNCGQLAALATITGADGKEISTTRGNVSPPRRPRVTTHNMTGPDIALGKLTPSTPGLASTPALSLPVQSGRPDLSERVIFSGQARDPVYDLPLDVDARRQQLLRSAASLSLAGTPTTLDRNSAVCDTRETVIDENGDEVPNSHFGECALSIKAWAMNVNGGHQVAAGFSQERPIWLEITVEDLGRPLGNNLYQVVDCTFASLDDLYTSASDPEHGFPVRQPRTHTTDSATQLFNRMTGTEPGHLPSSEDHARLCRGLSGHLIDKPHDETHEPVGDGVLDDEDILLHRIGNTLPVVIDDACVAGNPGGDDNDRNGVPDTCETDLVSWHVADVGFDYGDRFCSDGAGGAAECGGGRGRDRLTRYPDAAAVAAAKARPDFSPRIARADQFHIPGLNVYTADLTSSHWRSEGCEGSPGIADNGDRDATGIASNPNCDHARGYLIDNGLRPDLSIDNDPRMEDLPVQTRDGRFVPLASLGSHYREGVTYTPDERLELLYPFPEFPGLVPRFDDDGTPHLGERFGLAYLTNIFYRITGCAHGECEGPKEISFDWRGKRHDLKAQVPWLITYPTLPHIGTLAHDEQYHFILGDDPEHLEEYAYISLLRALESWQEHEVEVLGEDVYKRRSDLHIGAAGTPYGEAFTFIPLNSNHMPNNRSMVFYRPQRHYWDIRVGADVVGPIRVHVKMWYRHFPPEFLRLMARYTEGLYLRAVAEGKACPPAEPDCIPAEQNWFPHGPLVVEGEMARLFPQAPSIDNLRRVLLDEAVVHVAVRDGQQAGGAFPQLPERPSKRDVAHILDNHCMPCHADILRHGGLVLAYDNEPRWDVAGGQTSTTVQDWTKNVVGQTARYGNLPLVTPGDPDASLLYRLISATDAEFANAKMADTSIRSRPMPLKQDRISPEEIEIVRRWIENGAN